MYLYPEASATSLLKAHKVICPVLGAITLFVFTSLTSVYPRARWRPKNSPCGAKMGSQEDGSQDIYIQRGACGNAEIRVPHLTLQQPRGKGCRSKGEEVTRCREGNYFRATCAQAQPWAVHTHMCTHTHTSGLAQYQCSSRNSTIRGWTHRGCDPSRCLEPRVPGESRQGC